MRAPKDHLRSIAVFLILSFSLSLVIQAQPPAAREGLKKNPAPAGAPAPGFVEQAGPGRAAPGHSRLLPSLIGLAVAGAVVAVLVLTVFKKSGYNPHIIPQDFVEGISNPFFPQVPGQTRHYAVSGGTPDLRLTVTPTANTRMIMGVLCQGVQDRLLDSVRLFEDTWRWYAQDRDGNVWIFAQETKKYDYDVLTEDSSWQAGSNGAKPGMVMVGHPQNFVNKEFQLDFVPGVAEDRAMVLGVNETVTVPFGTFSGCVKIKVFSSLEAGKEEFRYFSPGTGLVLSDDQLQGGRRQELVGIGGE